MTVSIRQKYDGLKAFLLPGVYNLSKDEIRLAKRACEDILAALPQVTLSFDLEDERRILTNQIKIILRELEEILLPSFVTEVSVTQNCNLYQLSLEHLGDALRWTELAELNALEEPFLTDAQVLKLPVK